MRWIPFLLFAVSACRHAPSAAPANPPQKNEPAVSTHVWTAPDYARPEAFAEEEISFGEELALPGTLTTPKGGKPVAAVVLVHGSGPHDRDEDIYGTRVFKDLAWGLASRGIAVLRYEKVTKAHPYEWLAKYGENITLDNETTDDA